jgi:alpha-N-arabinofuranosidase
MKILFALLLLLSALTPVVGQTLTKPGSVVATVDASKIDSPISPYLYGQFLEHIGNMVYKGVWSEMLDDRKFYFPVQPANAQQALQAGVAGRSRRFGAGVAAGRWNPIGPADSVIMDTTDPYVGDHTPLVTLAGDEPRGILQTGVRFHGGEAYIGRVILNGRSSTKASIVLLWSQGATELRQLLPLGKLNARYKKYQFSFRADGDGPATLEIQATGTGRFHIGASSLMPANNVDGFRPDVVAVLKSLHSGVYRFPGGNYISAFEWRNAVGDPDKRPPVMDPVWNAVQSNDIGTDEFIRLCRLIDVEPYITVNAGFGDENSAAQLVQYVNGADTTPMGKWRAKNGNPKPYHVKFFGIGNEMWGDYQYGYISLAQYEVKHNLFAKAMRKEDPSIVLIASGAMPDTMTGSGQSLHLGSDLVPKYLSPEDWTGGLLTHCFDNFDMISEHFYNYGDTHYSLAQGKQVPNDPGEPVTDWMRRPANHIRLKYEEYEAYVKRLPELITKPKPLDIDEWAYAGSGPYPTYPAYAWVLQEMFRHTDFFQMACQTFATSLLTTDGNKVSLNGNGLVFKIYRDHFGTIPVEVTGNLPQPIPTDPPGGEQPSVNAGSDTFPLDVVAAWTADREALSVAVLNPTNVNHNLSLNINGANLSGSGTLWQLALVGKNGSDPTIESVGMNSIPELLTVPGYSVNIYVLPVKPAHN